MVFQDALAYLDQFVNYEQTTPPSYEPTFRLPRMRRLLDALRHPERRWPAIHVAGTKGKGSTCALAASMLHAQGYRVGLYTSPHLVSVRERIQLNGQGVSEAELVEAVEALRPAVATLPAPPTFFEIYTAMAFWLFARWHVDLAVVEVGLGGRLDATNVVEPVVSVITPISFDHTELLGTTLAAIAAEKAGIIKSGRPVVVAPQPPEALAVIRAAARAAGAPCLEVARQVSAEVLAASLEGQQVVIQTPSRRYPTLTLPLLGHHQVINLATAVAALEALPPPWPVTPEAVVEGAARVQWPGRLQVLERRPWLLLDGAQNAASAEVLAEAVRTLWPDQRSHLVLGMSVQKDVEGMAAALAPLSPASVIATQAQVPRALPADQLAARLRPWFPAVELAASVEAAVARASDQAAAEDVIVVTGSFFVLGELLQRESVVHV